MRNHVLPAATLALIAAAGLTIAGPLNPPAGPIGPTYKTLGEIEPRIPISIATTPGDNDATPSTFKITQPGAYYLTGNAAGGAGRIGIEIAASGVTIDLSGFSLSGVALSAAGIKATVIGADVSIRNGSVIGWGQEGIHVVSITGARLEGITASTNTGAGIMGGPSGVIRGCSALANGGAGLVVGVSGTLSDSTATGNGGDGISAGFASTLDRCASRLNTGDGFDTAAGVTLHGCTGSGNTGAGIRAASSATITACTAGSNTLEGIIAGSGSSIASCTSNANTGIGISTFGSSVSGCAAQFNTGVGFKVSAATITGCTAYRNTADGFELGASSHAARNTAYGNGEGGNASGFHVIGQRCRLEDNTADQNDRGFDVDTTFSIIIRNSAMANTVNFDIPAGNMTGPLIAGNNPIASTSPYANFSN